MPVKLTKLNDNEEKEFQNWYQYWSTKIGIDPNPDNPLHYYDYRAAFKNNALPVWDSEYQEYHWPSEFKLDDHPRLIVDGVNTRTGEKAE